MLFKIVPLKLTLALFSLIFLSACSTAQLSYRVDPEIKNLKALTQTDTVVAISVIDERLASNQASTEDRIVITGDSDEITKLKAKFVSALNQNNVRVISNPLLADFSLTLTIERFDVIKESSFIKSTIRVDSRIRLTAKNQDESLEKIYNKQASQEVANPVNNNDVTGLVNKVLTQQLSQMLAEPELISLSKKKSFGQSFNR
jgi:uncharacterized lipoprotein YajG